MLPDEQASSKQIEIWGGLAGVKRLHLAELLYWSAGKLIIAGLCALHPEWPQERLEMETRRIFLRAGGDSGTFRKAACGGCRG